MVKIILDNIYNKTVPRPINLRPGYMCLTIILKLITIGMKKWLK